VLNPDARKIKSPSIKLDPIMIRDFDPSVSV